MKTPQPVIAAWVSGWDALVVVLEESATRVQPGGVESRRGGRRARRTMRGGSDGWDQVAVCELRSSQRWEW